MENEQILPLIVIFCFLLRCIPAAVDNCRPASCGPTEPVIRFPFHISGRQPYRCGFPGFALSCNKQNRTAIRLPSSRSYIVTRIDYVSQAIYVDPDFCRRNGLNSLSVTGTPFEFINLRRYSFYNCSLQNFGFMYPAVPFPCLDSKNYSVIAVRTGMFSPGSMPSSCHVMKTIAVPVQWNGDVRSELELIWFSPSSRSCENDGGGCGTDDGESGGFGSSRGFTTSTKYGLALGIGLPVSIALSGLLCYAASRPRDDSETRHQSVDLFSIAIIPQPPSRTGLDGLTIESYPKTIIGESFRLPNDDSACAICLSDYKAKESLRTIPECNHYFHVDCIDQWLKLNATCPVCRNSPDSSSLVTSSSLASTTSVDSS